MRVLLFKCYCFTLAVLALSGCSKSSGGDSRDDQGNYFVRFRLAGEQKDYATNGLAQFYYDEDNEVYRCNMIGSEGTNTALNAMSLFLVNKVEFTTGVTYQLKNEVIMAENGAPMPQVWFSYLEGSGKAYTAQFLPAQWYDFEDEAQVIFTEITDKYVKGSFSGKMFSLFPERAEVSVTDGSFYLAVY